jgi:hypothetical protein
MNAWLRHVFIMTAALLLYYVVTFVVIYATIMGPTTSSAIIADGGSPSAEIASSIESLFPIPAILWLLGVVLSRWIAF